MPRQGYLWPVLQGPAENVASMFALTRHDGCGAMGALVNSFDTTRARNTAGLPGAGEHNPRSGIDASFHLALGFLLVSV